MYCLYDYWSPVYVIIDPLSVWLLIPSVWLLILVCVIINPCLNDYWSLFLCLLIPLCMIINRCHYDYVPLWCLLCPFNNKFNKQLKTLNVKETKNKNFCCCFKSNVTILSFIVRMLYLIENEIADYGNIRNLMNLRCGSILVL